MAFHGRLDETAEWLNYLQPEGLVVGPNVLRRARPTPLRQTPLDTEAAAALGFAAKARARRTDTSCSRSVALPLHGPALAREIRRRGAGRSAVSAGSRQSLTRARTLLDRRWHCSGAGRGRGSARSGAGHAPPRARRRRPRPVDGTNGRRPRTSGSSGCCARPASASASSSPRNTLRLIYAPRGETAGWISCPLARARPRRRPADARRPEALRSAASACSSAQPDLRLRAAPEGSREAQNEVSAKLAGQVLGALHELLRGLHAADRARIERLAANDPHHLYEGLLTGLMRLVFLLYAEDRDLLPSSRRRRGCRRSGNPATRSALYARLADDAALHPDTMDERRGAWGQLLALFRLVHGGYPRLDHRPRRQAVRPRRLPVPRRPRQRGDRPTRRSAGLRRLHPAHPRRPDDARRPHARRRASRERLSYRTLDVEQIGSVYETVMGFTAAAPPSRMIALKDEKKLPTFVDLDRLLAQKPADREK